MLVFKCSACRRKLLRYHKLGQGEVHRCHKERIDKFWHAEARDEGLWCACGLRVGMDRGTFYTMVKKHVTYSGTKTNV
ncbi:MAG: hypothetical protein AB7D51_03155 [Desulfovibrionaceae bacterium]